MQKLVRLSALLLFVFALGAYVTPSGSAQEKAGSKTVTGCLQKGDETGEYSITGEDGKTYGLRSKSVKLSQHVGHKPAILVGHSYGGSVITAAGTDARVAALVYLAAFAPDDDETTQSLQETFPATDIFSHIEVADGRVG
jgi:Alpha/beta hydrolase family